MALFTGWKQMERAGLCDEFERDEPENRVEYAIDNEL
jgi:hypothetical protein